MYQGVYITRKFTLRQDALKDVKTTMLGSPLVVTKKEFDVIKKNLLNRNEGGLIIRDVLEPY